MPIAPLSPPATPQWVDALLYEPDGDRLRCTLCPTECRLADGDTGSCRVRRRLGDRLQTSTFASSVFHTDTVERKPLYHFCPGLMLLTLAAPGCTFSCDYCQNHRLSQFGRVQGSPWSARPVTAVEIVERARRAGAGIAFSYSEPSLAIELTLAIFEALDGERRPIVWKTNGFLTPTARVKAAAALTAANIDIKCGDSTRHRALTGAPLAPVLETIGYLVGAGVWVEVSTPIIPGVSSTPAQMTAIAAAIADISPTIPVHIVRVFPDFRMGAQRPTSADDISRAVDIAKTAGLRYVYVERLHGSAGRETKCLGCGDVLLERDIWLLRRNHTIDGRCGSCGAITPGRWTYDEISVRE